MGLCQRIVIIVAALLGAAGVAAAAAAAHIGNDPLLSPLALVALTHAAALIGLASAATTRFTRIATAVIAAGAVIFCGELGFHYLTGSAALTPIAPVGGTALIVGWLALAVCTAISPQRAG